MSPAPARGGRRSDSRPAHGPRAGNNPALNAYAPTADLFVLKPWRSSLALLADWGLIAASFACAALWPHPLMYLLAALVIARSQLALAVIMHESAHGLLLRQQRWNDRLGQWCAAGPLFLSLRSYRAGHLKHHRQPMQHDDPVAVVFGLRDYPLPPSRLGMRLLADLCGVGYCISALRFARGDYRTILPTVARSPWHVLGEGLSMLGSNGVLFALLAWTGHPLLYVGLWLLPAMTLLPFLGRVRAIMEHAGLPPCDDQSQSARSIVRRSWQTFVFGPHAAHYHIEHHLFVRMPFYHLRRAHQQLTARGLLPDANLYNGYMGVLRDVSNPLRRPPTA